MDTWFRKAGKRMFVSLEEGDFQLDCRAGPAHRWEGGIAAAGAGELPATQRAPEKGLMEAVRGLRGPQGPKQRTELQLTEVEPLLSVAPLVATSLLDPLPPLSCIALFLRQHFKAIDREALRNCLVPSGSRSPWP